MQIDPDFDSDSDFDWVAGESFHGEVREYKGEEGFHE